MPPIRPVLCLVLGLAACTLAPVPRAPEPPLPRWQTVDVDADVWAGPPAQVRSQLTARLETASRDGARVVLFRLRRAGNPANGFDPLAFTLDEAASRNLRLHVAVDVDSMPRAALRQVLRHVAQNYAVDGIQLRGDGPEAIRAAAVTVWLVKPYLPLSHAPAGSAGTDALTGQGLQPVAELRSPAADPIPLWRLGAAAPIALDLSGAGGDRASSGYSDVRVQLDSATVCSTTTDAAGQVNLLVRGLPDTLRLGMADTTLALPTRFWKSPYDFVVRADGSLSRAAPWVELRAAPKDTTTRAVFEILGRTDPGASSRIDGVQTKVYGTGVFFDSVALAPGVNRIRLETRWPDGRRALYEDEVVRVAATPRAAFPPWIEPRSLSPNEDRKLLSDDVVRLSFRGSPGGHAVARLHPGGMELPFTRTDDGNAATYETDLALSRLRMGRSYRVEIRLEVEQEGQSREIRRDMPGNITVAELCAFPLLVTSRTESYLSYSLGAVRLGGPFIAEYPEGVVLQANGRLGDHYRVRLGPTSVGYIHERYVDELPAGAVRPRYHLRSVLASVTDSTDVLAIPWTEPVPWAVRSDPAGRRIVVTLYGVEASSTWLSQRAGLRLIDRVTWRQADVDTYELSVELTTGKIWGYDLVPDGGSLRLTLRHAPWEVAAAKAARDSLAVADRLSAADLPVADLPVRDLPVTKPDTAGAPLAGLRIVIEAGHGGDNTGAIGLSGLLERDVNLATALTLGELCRAAGAEVQQLRADVDGVPYMARRDSARASGADIFLSVHANAAGGGFLRISGTSTFYHDPFWEPLASRIYAHLVGELGLGEFGAVGSFNYRPTRMSSMPAVLVEQAFMTHAEDEELLASEAGRRAIAEQVVAGLVEWVEWMRGSD